MDVIGKHLRSAPSAPSPCSVCHNEEHIEGARFCMICGSPLEGCQGSVRESIGSDQYESAHDT